MKDCFLLSLDESNVEATAVVIEELENESFYSKVVLVLCFCAEVLPKGYLFSKQSVNLML